MYEGGAQRAAAKLWEGGHVALRREAPSRERRRSRREHVRCRGERRRSRREHPGVLGEAGAATAAPALHEDDAQLATLDKNKNVSPSL